VRFCSVASASAKERRSRTRSHKSRIGGGGTKLGLIRPWRTRSAVHSASLTRHCLDVMGVGDDQLEVAFQDGMDRLSVNPGALHADMRDAQPLEPVPQRLQVPGHGREGSNLLARLASPISTQATTVACRDRHSVR
jgi:hypothetical protein